MTDWLTAGDRVARARAAFRIGAPIVIAVGEAGCMVIAAELINDRRLKIMRSVAETLDLALTSRRADTLRVRAYDGDLARIALETEADARLIRALADPAMDLAHPMKSPLAARRNGDATLHRGALALCKQARLLPAALISLLPDADTARALARFRGLEFFDLADLGAAPALSDGIEHVSSAHVPLEISESARLHVFRPCDGSEEHYAIEFGAPHRSEPVLTRLHSACFTGDLMGSLKCDCGSQLRTAMRQMAAADSGVLLYLNQEGRGIGLANKMRAYSLQDQGFDTVEANHRLGFEDDERDFRIGAEILKRMGFSHARLMTNNPVKVEVMSRAGMQIVERVPLAIPPNRHNSAYLKTKATKSGHLL